MNRPEFSPVGLRLLVLLVKSHYILLVPWVVLSVAPMTVLGQPDVAIVVIAIVGLYGTLSGSKRLIVIASSSLIAVLVGGKILADIARLGSPDTAVLLSQFIAIIFTMEASFPVVEYEAETAMLQGRTDEVSARMMSQLQRWFRHQLAADAKLGIACFIMSLGLLTLGGLSSVRVGQFALLAVLVLASVIALFVLLTYRREPETAAKKTRK